jgi:HAD superfamily hydrolase (TIGR01509 family)
MFNGKDLKLSDYFGDIFISSDIGLIKPDPEIFKFCVDKLGVDPSECVFIDDKKKNTESANSVGMNAYLFEDNESFKKWLSDNEF